MIAFRSPGAVLWPAQGWQRCRWSEGWEKSGWVGCKVSVQGFFMSLPNYFFGHVSCKFYWESAAWGSPKPNQLCAGSSKMCSKNWRVTHGGACHQICKNQGKKMMTMLDPFGKSKRRVQKKYLVCRNGLKFKVIYIPHEITSWYQPTINPTKESCPCAMAGSCGSFVFPGRGAFPIPGAEFWVIFIHMFWDIQFSLLIYW